MSRGCLPSGPFPLALLTILFAACSRGVPPEPADLVLTGGRIVTMDPEGRTAEAVAVKGDRIVAVGAAAEIGRLVGADTRVMPLDGRTVVPGFIDAHVHFVGLGSRLLQLDARDRSKEEIVRMVAGRVAQAKPGDWIQGRGWDQNKWDVKEFPARDTLDAVAPDNPVYLGRVDGHAAWVNSAALQLAGITRGTPDPPGGQIIRDARGEPTGTLIDNAFRLVSRLIPPPSREQRIRSIELAIAECLASGLTSVHETGGFREDIELYEELMRAGRFDVRIYGFLRYVKESRQDPGTASAVGLWPPRRAASVC